MIDQLQQRNSEEEAFEGSRDCLLATVKSHLLLCMDLYREYKQQHYQQVNHMMRITRIHLVG